MKFPRAVLRPLVAILVPAFFLGPLISFRRATAQAIQANSSQNSITQLGPLTLSDLKVTAGSQGVLIEWRTTYELDNLGFNIYREQNGRREQINLLSRASLLGEMTASIAHEVNQPLSSIMSILARDVSGKTSVELNAVAVE